MCPHEFTGWKRRIRSTRDAQAHGRGSTACASHATETAQGYFGRLKSRFKTSSKESTRTRLDLRLTRLLIGQPLAFGTFNGALGALNVADAEPGALVVTEIELAEVAP